MAKLNYKDTPDDQKKAPPPSPPPADPDRFKPTDDSDWGWIVEVKDKHGSWKRDRGPFSSHANARAKAPENTNDYRIIGSRELGDELRAKIAEEERRAREERMKVRNRK